MAKNTLHRFRRSAVRNRSHVKGPCGWVKRGPDGLFMDVKSTGKPFKA